MPAEVYKAKARFSSLLVGVGLDIGCGDTPITDTCDRWDKKQGDAQYLAGVPDLHYDWIFSSHCLEHMRNPMKAVQNWWNKLKVGGYLILLVPDEDLYEQGVWPPTFNRDHRNSYTLSKDDSWCDASINLVDLLSVLPSHKLMDLSIQDSGYDYTRKREDQTANPTTEAACQMIVRKLPPQPTTHSHTHVDLTFHLNNKSTYVQAVEAQSRVPAGDAPIIHI